MKVYRFLFLFLCFIVFIACNPLVEEENNDPPSPGDNDSSSLIDHFSSYGVSHMGAGKLSGIAESAGSVSLAALAEDYVRDNGLLNLRRMKGGSLCY